MVYRNKLYIVIILHITYSFWGLRPQVLTGALPLDPAARWGTSVPQTTWSAITPPCHKIVVSRRVIYLFYCVLYYICQTFT